MSSEKNVLIVAGESSADRYAAQLVQRLRQLESGTRIAFFGTGGDRMQQAGVCLLAHIRDLAHIGPSDALSHFRRYYSTYRALLHRAEQDRPAVAVLLDFPDFNLRLAKKMKRAGVGVIYYISPQLWAWRRGRIRTVRRYVDKMLVILPFEEEYYRSRGVAVEFVGHPLLEDFAPDCGREQFLRRLDLDPRARTVALLPGSRRKEVDHILATLLLASVQLLDKGPAQFLISAAPAVDPEHLRRILDTVVPSGKLKRNFRIVRSEARDVLANSDFAFVKSGTSTLEAALVGTPFLVVYKISPVSWLAGNILIRSEFKGLVNLIAGDRIVPEFLQGEATPEALAHTALQYLESEQDASRMKSRLAGIRAKLGARCASEAAAAAVHSLL